MQVNVGNQIIKNRIFLSCACAMCYHYIRLLGVVRRLPQFANMEVAMSVNFTPNYESINGNLNTLKPFRFWCQKVLPLVYDDSLSYYELLNKVVQYLNDTMENVDGLNENVNTLDENVRAVYSAYDQLQGYVNNYFDNLNVQNEINNKLDEMALDGTLSVMINTIAVPMIPGLVSEWLEENVEPTTPVIDASLSIAGAAADAKATGDKVNELKNAINTLGDVVIDEYAFGNDIIHYNISPSTGKWLAAPSYDFHYFEKPTNAKLLYIKSNATNGTIYALLSADDAHISGDEPSYATGCTRTLIPANTDAYVIIPDDCKYIWITKTLSSGSYEPQYIGFSIKLSDVENELAEVENELAELDRWKDETEGYLPINVFNGTLTSGLINVSTGAVNTTTSGLKTDFIDVSAYQKIKYTRVVTTASTAVWGMTFYDETETHLEGTGEKPILGGDSYSYTLSEIEVPSGAKYARFTWSNALPNVFAIYDTEQYENSLVGDVDSLAGDIERLDSYHPNYSGKILSILGDSISSFALPSEKTDGKAAEGCTTNYPGNPVQYSNSNVTSVDLTWWGQVLKRFDMVLGINESWAGSTIGYNPNQTSGGKYTADNCLCSATRIGHLGENGTPDVIIVFGGTNDINHHRVSNGSTLRYAVGSLDSEHNPYDYDNFPMITDTYYGSITTMLLRIQHTYPNAIILMILPYFCTYTHTSSGDRATPYDQNEWSNAAIDVCKYLGVEYLDLRSIINLYDVSSLLFDDLHPKANGMEAIAKAVIHKLNNML